MDDKVTVTPVSPGGYSQGGFPGGPGFPAPPGFGSQPAPRRSGCVGAWAFLATLGLGLSLFLNVVLVGAKGGGDGGSSGPTSLHEKVVEGEGDDKIALITIEGVIMDKGGGGLFGAPPGEGLVKRIKDQLEKAAKDDQVKAVVLDVDSPGGGVTASDQLWHHLSGFRVLSKGKPLVVHQGSLAASGGYYVSAAGDEIVSEQTTITGSIGVILGGGINAHRFLKEHGFEEMTITSGPNKDLLSMTGPPREEHKKILQETVDDMYGRFCWVVAEGIARRQAEKAGKPFANEKERDKAIDEIMPAVKKLADGRIYTASQAKELNLVDGIGYLDEAVDRAKKRAKITTAKLIRYKKEPTLMEVLSGGPDARLVQLGGVSVRFDAAAIEELRSPRVLALWRGE